MAINYNSFFGNLLFMGWNGRLIGLQSQHGPYARLGQIGSGTQVTAVRAPICTIRTWCGFSTGAQAAAFADLAESYQAQTWPCQDDYGRSFARVRMHSCASDPIRGGIGSELASGILMTAVCELTMQLEVLP